MANQLDSKGLESLLQKLLQREGITDDEKDAISQELAEREAIEEELRRRTEYLKAIFENAPEAIFLYTAKGVFLDGNKKAEEYIGYSREELIGKNFLELDLLVTGLDKIKAGIMLGWSYAGRKTGPDLFTLRRKDGNYIRLEISTSPTMIDGKNVILGIARDLSSLKSAEKEALLERDKAQQYFDLSGTILVALDDHGRVSAINPKGAEVIGQPLHEIVGQEWFKTYLPEASREQTFEVFGKLIRGEMNPVEHYENPVVNSMGEERLIAWHNALIRDESGKITGTLSSGVDVTERKKAENALQTSEKKYRLLIENLNEGIWQIDEKGFTSFANSKLAEMLGYSVQEMAGKHLFDFMDEQGKRIAEANIEERKQGQSSRHDFEFIRKDGAKVYAHLETSPIMDENGKYLGALAGVQDITEKKKSEEKLRESEEKYRTLFEISPDGIVITDRETKKFRYANRSFCELIGYSPEEVSNLGVVEIHPKGSLDRIISEFEALVHGEKNISRDLPCIRKDGKVVFADIGTTQLTIEGKMYQVGVFRDVTDRKEAKEKLEESLARLDLALQSAQMGAWYFDLVTGMRYFDDSTCLRLGIDPKTFTGKPEEFFKALHPDDIPKVQAALKETIEHDTPYKPEYRVVHSDGSVHYIAARGCIVRDNNGKPMRLNGIVWDVTERKNLEERLRHAEKLDALGKLAGGIAHDFNNVLAGVNGYAEMLVQSPELPPQLRRYAANILTAGTRAAGLTRQLVSFVRKGDKASGHIDLNELIAKEVVSAAEMALPRKIVISADNLRCSSKIVGDKDQLFNILLNMSINAEHAMPDGGELSFLTEEVSLRDYTNRTFNEKFIDGNYVVLTVRDTGIGIEPSLHTKIFEEFFTTKSSSGKGTGLGLSAVLGTVKTYNGQVEVYSEPGKGTAFKLYFPATKAALAPEEEKKKYRGEGLVAVADDNEGVREMAVEMLKNLGYLCLVARNGKELVTLVDENRDGIDAVFTDLDMPEMDGLEAALYIRSVCPNLPIIITSGHGDTKVEKVKARKDLTFLPKPYSATELSRSLYNLTGQEKK